MALKRAKMFIFCYRGASCLTAEAVQGAALTLEGIDDVHGGDGLPLGVLGVGDGITDDVLEENLENTASLLVDEARDTFHTTTASQTADGGLGDTLDVITKHLTVTLGSSLSQTLSSFAATRHVYSLASEANYDRQRDFALYMH